jgi:hypothetical protein
VVIYWFTPQKFFQPISPKQREDGRSQERNGEEEEDHMGEMSARRVASRCTQCPGSLGTVTSDNTHLPLQKKEKKVGC